MTHDARRPGPPWDPYDDLDPDQRSRLRQYHALLRDFNAKINLISREDASHIDEHHLLHCLVLARRPFPPGSTVVDWGTGGGLPAVPLAIAFPAVTFLAVDAVSKKVRAVRAMARRLGLDNLEARHARAEALDARIDFSVSRATAPLRDLWSWHARVRRPGIDAGDGAWPPGLICLKGGDLSEEVADLAEAFPDVVVERHPIFPLLQRPYYRDKHVVVVRGG